MSESGPDGAVDAYQSPLSTLTKLWLCIAVATWAVALALTVTPPLADGATLGWIGVAVVVVAAMVVALSERLRNWPAVAVHTSNAVAIVGWAALMFHDDRWAILSFALFSMCFTKGKEIGIVLAAIVSAIWLVAEIAADSPRWTLLSPFTAFAVGTIVSIMIYRVGHENEEQAALIAELQETRDELAASERDRATLAERARFAGEVHDTLAQGFTSIVLLSRAAQRTEDWRTGLATIETTAEQNLAAARRLVEALRPAELDRTSLTDALRRQLDTLGEGVTTSLVIEGTLVPLDPATETALLRAAQEALLNVRTHADASTVHVTLSYMDSTVVLDIIDDGIGLTADAVTDRGILTGGQGLASLRQRAETLGGQLVVESGHGGGTAVSVQLPRSQP